MRPRLKDFLLGLFSDPTPWIALAIYVWHGTIYVLFALVVVAAIWLIGRVLRYIGACISDIRYFLFYDDVLSKVDRGD